MPRPRPEPVDPFTEPRRDELWFEEPMRVSWRPRYIDPAAPIQKEAEEEHGVTISIPFAVALLLLAMVGLYELLKWMHM